MKKYLVFVLLLFGLPACTGTIIEDGAAQPTVDLPTVAPVVLSPVPTLTDSATAAPVATAVATETAQPPAATAVPPTETPLPPPATSPADPAPVRIQFAPGTSTATITGQLAAGESVEYLAWAMAGQLAHIELTSANNVANFSLVGQSDGQPYKRVENENRFWDGHLSLEQDYLIRLRTLTATEYTLIVTIEPLGAILQPLWPVVDGLTGFLLGGSHNGEWVDPVVAMKSLQDGERPYQLYAGTVFQGTVVGQAPLTSGMGPCGGTPTVPFPSDSDLSGTIALVAPWDAAPRQAEALPLDIPEYEAAVAELLAGDGLLAPEIELTDVQRIDLEGDGVDEVIIVANHLTGLGNGLPTAHAGDYALVGLRRLVGGVVQTTLLLHNSYPEPVELANPTSYNLLGLLDLNGDGQLEIVVEGWQYEGRQLAIFAVASGGIDLVMNTGCRQ